MLPIYPLAEEIALQKPVSYTCEEEMMEDVVAARLDEPLPAMTVSFEQRARGKFEC